jgi:hypothetical protein
MIFRKEHPTAKKDEDDGKNSFMLVTEPKLHNEFIFSSAANPIQ